MIWTLITLVIIVSVIVTYFIYLLTNNNLRRRYIKNGRQERTRAETPSSDDRGLTEQWNIQDTTSSSLGTDSTTTSSSEPKIRQFLKKLKKS